MRQGFRSKRPVWLVVLVAVVGLVLIGAAQVMPNRHSMQDNLTQRSIAALDGAGLKGFQVSFVGRDGSVVVASSAEVDRARDIVGKLDGVRVVSARAIELPAPTRTPTVTVKVDGGQVSVVGGVPTEAARAALTTALGGATQSQLTVDTGVTDAGLTGLPAVVRAFGSTSKGVTIELRDGKLTLTGTVESSLIRDAAIAASGQAVTAANVVDRLVVSVPPEVVQRGLTDLPQITFENDSATLTAAGQAAVAKAAELLRTSPGAKVRIEGHTDGNGTPASNLVLSRARARSVMDSLISLGISADRLTAAGFGETRPKVPDTSAENRAINRRVEFVVLT